MRRLYALLTGLAVLTPLPALALDPGTARGELAVNGQKVTLTHSYALRQDNAEGLMDGPELRLLFADREVSPEVLAGPVLSDVDRLAREGAVRGLVLRVAADRTPESVNGTVLFPPADPQASLPFFTKSGAGAGFTRFQLGDNRVVGEAEMQSDRDPSFKGMAVYEYRVSFSAPIFQDRKVTASLKGKEARESAPARAFLAFEKALREGDLAKVRAAVIPARWKELETYLAQVGEAQFKAQAREMSPPTATRQKQIERVVVREDRATVIYKEPGATGFQSLVREGEVWKVGG